MIICTNCGTSNKNENHICRNCGALLPISTKTPRVKIAEPQKQNEQSKAKIKSPEPVKSGEINPLDLQEIPKQTPPQAKKDPFSPPNSIPPPKPITKDFQNEVKPMEIGKGILREITPQPFRGSIIASKGVYGPPSENGGVSAPESQSSQESENYSSEEAVSEEFALIKQKQLEIDMTKVLKVLSDKITIKEVPVAKKENISGTKSQKEEIPPSSMNEILKELLKLDLHIEASAIIRRDGTILASAISSRMSDSLFATIGQNLSMIGSDIIEGLSAGKLTNISIRGTEGVLDLAPIIAESDVGNDMILIIFSSPRVKSGIINFAANIVKKQVKEYLGISK